MTVTVVTGASGYIATELIKQLLEKGYEVRGTVRDPSNKTKVSHLEALGEALPGKLTLHAADLMKDGSFDSVVKGAHIVFHTASPVVFKAEDPLRDIVNPAVHGTTTLMESVIKSKDTVQRVVLTSSVAAIMRPTSGPSNGKCYTDKDWNDDASIENGQAYRVSKVRAEKAAWAIAKEQGISLVTIHPSFVAGPVISSRTDAFSINAVKDFLEGRTDHLFPALSLCNVVDVAKAHVLAAEVPTANGRYIVSFADPVQVPPISEALSRAFPAYKFPPGQHKEEDRPPFDTHKIEKELGFSFSDPTATLVDMARTLFATGVAKPVLKQS